MTVEVEYESNLMDAAAEMHGVTVARGKADE